MQRAFDIRVERGNNWDAWEYVVVAASDEEAVRKAKKQAHRDSGVKGGWRTTRLAERKEGVVV